MQERTRDIIITVSMQSVVMIAIIAAVCIHVMW